MQWKKLLPFVLMAPVLSFCTNDNEEDLYSNTPVVECKSTNISYNTDVKPILDLNCAFSGCHGAQSASGGINLSSPESIQQISAELIINSINHAPNAYAMPPTGQKLSNCNIQLITNWLNEGAQNN